MAAPQVYNPSSWKQRVSIAVIAFGAMIVALYLGFYQWGVILQVWDPIFGDGTAKVLDSELSHLFTSWIRIPDAVLGVFAYFSDALFALAGSERRWQDRPWLVIVFGIDVIPLGIVSVILVMLQGLAVKYWCTLCLFTAAISISLIVLAYDEVLLSCLYLHEVKRMGGWKKAWWALWGYPCAEAIEAGEVALKRRKGAKKDVGSDF